MQSFDLAHGVAQTLPTLRQPVDRTGGRFRIAFPRMVTFVIETFMSWFPRKAKKGEGAWYCLVAVFCDSYNNQIKALSPSSQHITTSRKRVGNIGLRGNCAWSSACSGFVKAVAPSKLTYILRANPLDASIWGAWCQHGGFQVEKVANENCHVAGQICFFTRGRQQTIHDATSGIWASDMFFTPRGFRVDILDGLEFD